jgi:hypothetical protein
MNDSKCNVQYQPSMECGPAFAGFHCICVTRDSCRGKHGAQASKHNCNKVSNTMHIYVLWVSITCPVNSTYMVCFASSQRNMVLADRSSIPTRMRPKALMDTQQGGTAMST